MGSHGVGVARSHEVPSMPRFFKDSNYVGLRGLERRGRYYDHDPSIPRFPCTLRLIQVLPSIQAYRLKSESGETKEERDLSRD